MQGDEGEGQDLSGFEHALRPFDELCAGRPCVLPALYKVPADRPAHEVADAPRLRDCRWCGPGRVLAVETKITEHGAIQTPTLPTRVVWIVPQKQLKKVRGSQLRHASETERDIANANTALTLPWTFTTVVGLLEKGAYDDYTNEETRGRSAFGTRTPGRRRGRSRARSVP